MVKNPKNLDMLIDIYKIPNMTATNSFIIDDHPDVKSSQVKRCITALNGIFLTKPI